MDLSVLFHMPFSIEVMPPKQADVGVSLVVSFTVGTFEQMGAWLALLGFQSRWVNFSISLAAPTEFSVVFRLVGAIVFDTLGSLYSAREGGVTPFPAVFALENSGIHVCSSNSSDVVANIEASVDKHFSIVTTLNILYIYPDNGHVGLQGNLIVLGLDARETLSKI